MRRLLAYSTRIYTYNLNENDVEWIRNDLKLYNKMLHIAYRKCYDKCFYHVENKELEKQLKQEFKTSDYLPLSAINEAKGLLKANIEKNKTDQKQVKQRIDNIENKIKEVNKKLKYYEKEQEKLIQKCKVYDYTEKDYLYEVKTVKPQIKQLKNRLKMLHFRKKRNEFKLMGLEKRVKQVCFGGKKNLKSNLELFKNKRKDRMLVPGRRQGKYGNNLFKYHVEEKVMVFRSSDHDIYIPLDFPHHKEELIRAVKLPHNTADKAIAYELKDHGEYFLIKAIIQAEDKGIIADMSDGAVGMDLNLDHFALVETNKEGNVVKRKRIEFDLKNKTANQRKHLMRECVKEMVEMCSSTDKPIVIEKLDFTYKKNKMTYGNKKQNQRLSEFATKQIKEMIESRCYKEGVAIKEVDPSYTSQIGRLKYQKMLGMSIHESAAYVIARRGQGFKEKVSRG